MAQESLEKSVKEIFKTLKEKEREILTNRFGLFGKQASTLASIGKNLSLTRERIRQIQNSALLKIKNSKEIQDEEIFSRLKELKDNQGGLISIKMVEDKLKTSFNYALFLLEASQGLKRIKGNKKLSSVFIDQDLTANEIINAEAGLIKILKSKTKAIPIDKLIKISQSKIKLEGKTLKSLIYGSRNFAFDWRNFVGLAIWREVNPKSARDKAYYILKKEERPLHFTHIADLITKEKFHGKNPTAATVHNELILDQRFALVGRGIYALSEWGFKGGTVEEVIADILRSNPKGMQRDAIIEEVLKSKLVARNTVMMNLLVKKQFERDKLGKYKLVK